MKAPSPIAPSPRRSSSVACVVVTFEIGRNVLPVLEAILPQVGRVFIVDNGSGGKTQTPCGKSSPRTRNASR